jgi:hypothetical protein
MTTSLGGIVQRGLDDECWMIDARRVVAPFGIVIASTAGQVDALILTKDELEDIGGGDFLYEVQ